MHCGRALVCATQAIEVFNDDKFHTNHGQHVQAQYIKYCQYSAMSLTHTGLYGPQLWQFGFELL